MMIRAEGMTCTNCAMGVQRTLERAGFTSVEVDFSSGRVVFDQDDEKHLQEAARLIRAMGYSVPGTDGEKKRGLFSNLLHRFIFSAIFTTPLLLHMVLPWHPLHDPWVQLALALPVYIAGMAFFGKGAWQSLKARVANMDVLVALGASAAFFYSLYGTLMNLGPAFQFYETAATIITVILLGNYLEHHSVKRTGSAIDELESLQGEWARKVVQTSTGAEMLEEVPVSGLQPGDIVQVNQGDPVPADGTVFSGSCSVDESMISGEGIPIDKRTGDTVLAGSLLAHGSVRMKVTQAGGKTVLAGIIELVRKAQMQKPELQNLADRISAWFVPAVVFIAMATFILTLTLTDIGVTGSALRAIAVLVVACPCALGLAIPTAVVVGIGLAARRGLMVKRADIFDSLARASVAVFDKTGTLSTGQFRLGQIETRNISRQEVLRIIHNLEKHSSHPLAQSLLRACGEQEAMELASVTETAGMGIEGLSPGGTRYWLGADDGSSDADEADLMLTINGETVASIHLEDEIREDAEAAIRELKALGLEPVMLTGDRESKAREMAASLGIARYHSRQRPQDKVRVLDELSAHSVTLMVGDGINDAPVLQHADAGISFSVASGAAQNSAQVIMLNERLLSLPALIRLSRMTQRTIRQNLFWVFFYNALAIPFAAAGLLSPMIAATAMALSDVIVVGNSLRLRWTYRRPRRSI